MTDNIKPEHYRKGEIDLFEEWYLTYPFDQYRAIMQSHAEKYLRRNKVNRVEDLDKCVETIRRLKEKEIEHAKKNVKTPEEALVDMGKAFGGMETDYDFRSVKTKIAGRHLEDAYRYHNDLLKRLRSEGYEYLARDENGELYAFKGTPKKYDDMDFWDTGANDASLIKQDDFPEIKWTDDEPTKISKLLASYENGGENGKVDGE